jgi:hypothetical protein
MTFALLVTGYALIAVAVVSLFLRPRPWFWLLLAISMISFAASDVMTNTHRSIVSAWFELAFALGYTGLFFRAQMKAKATGKRRKVAHDDDTMQVSLRELIHLNETKEDRDGR